MAGAYSDDYSDDYDNGSAAPGFFYRHLLRSGIMSLFVQSEGTAARRRFPLYLVDATDGLTPETGEAGGQPQISKAGGAFTNTSATLTAVGNGSYYVELTATELDTLGMIQVRYKSANTAEFSLPGSVVAANLMGTPDVNVAQLGGSTQSATDLKDFADTGYDPATHKVETVKTADALTANNDKAGYGLADGAITAAKIGADAITAAKIADGAIDANTFAAGAITAGAIAADAIGASELAADAVAEIQSGLSTLDGAGVQSALTAQGYTSTRAGYLDTLNGLVAAIWAAATSGLTAVGSIGKLLVDNINATISSRSSHAAADIWAVGTRTLSGFGTLVADIWSNGSRTLTANPGPSAADVADAVWDEATAGHTTSGTFGEQLKTDVDAILLDTGTDGVVVGSHTTAAKAELQQEAADALTAYAPATPAQVNTEVLDVLTVDTFAEPAGAPAATTSLKNKIGWIFKLHRNKRTQTTTTESVYADDGTTVDSTSTKGDDGTTFTRGEFT